MRMMPLLQQGSSLHVGAAMKQVGTMVLTFNKMLLEGVAAPELMHFGLTSEEERAACGASQVQPYLARMISQHA